MKFLMNFKQIFTIGIVVTCFSMMTGCTEKETLTLTMKEFIDNWVDNGNGTSSISIDPGDTVIIKDTIKNMTQVSNSATNSAYMQLSFESGGGTLNFDINVTEKYKNGDSVLITLHIIEVTYNGNNVVVIEETWDDNHKTFKPIPITSIHND